MIKRCKQYSVVTILLLTFSIFIHAEEGTVVSKCTYTFPLQNQSIELKRILTPEGTIELVSSSATYKTLADMRQLDKNEKAITPPDPVLPSGNENQRDIEVSGGDEDCKDCIDNADIDSKYDMDWLGYAFLRYPIGSSLDLTKNPYMGDGINIATFEHGVSSSLESSMKTEYAKRYSFEPTFGTVETSSYGDGGHNNMCFASMVNTAPKARFNHIKGSPNLPDIKTYNIEVASKSYLTSGYSNSLESMTYNGPNEQALICVPTGNYGVAFGPHTDAAWERDNSIHFNMLYVGGCQYTNREYFEIPSNSYYQYKDASGKWIRASPIAQTQCRNTRPLLGSGEIDGDKETPHLVGVSRTPCVDKNATKSPYSGDTFSGTSSATPSVVGVAATVIAANKSIMQWNIENVKTALLLTAENIDGDYWNPMIDGRDGCGVVSGYEAADYAKRVERKWENNQADDEGIAYGTIPNSSLLNGVTKQFNVKAPATLPEGKHLRAVLTWSVSVDASNSSKKYLTDLNLSLTKKGSNKILAQCHSFEDNIEVIDIPNCQLTAGEEYSLKLEVAEDGINFGPNPSHDYIKYTIGWVWVNDYAGKTVNEIDDNADYELTNRNIVFNGGSVLSSNTVNVTAEKSIHLKPGFKVNNGGVFSAKIVQPIAEYEFRKQFSDESDVFKNGGTSSQPLVSDLTGNLLHAVCPQNKQLAYETNRYTHEAKAIFMDGSTYFHVNHKNENTMPDLSDGFTVSMWVRLMKDENASGHLFTSGDYNGGTRLYLDDRGSSKVLTFYVHSVTKMSQFLSAEITQDDLIQYGKSEAWNEGWVLITAMWKPGETYKLMINDQVKAERPSEQLQDDFRTVPREDFYIGANPAVDSDNFRGAISMVKIYAGILPKNNVEGEYHAGSYPTYDCETGQLSVNITGKGSVICTPNYKSVQQVSPTTFDKTGTMRYPRTIKTGNDDFYFSFDFIPHAGYVVKSKKVDGLNHTSKDYKIGSKKSMIVDVEFEPAATTVFEDDFESGMGNWGSYVDNSASATINVVNDGIGNKVLHGAVSNTGSQNWHIHVRKTGLPLVYGGQYTLSFSAKTESGQSRTINVMLEENGGSWTNYSNAPNFTINGSYQNFSHDFTMTKSTDNDAVYVIDMGYCSSLDNIAKDVYIDNVKLLRRD